MDNIMTEKEIAAIPGSVTAPRPSLQPAALLAEWGSFKGFWERRKWALSLSHEDRSTLANALGARTMEEAKAWPIRA
jgi:hypothetical protein